MDSSNYSAAQPYMTKRFLEPPRQAIPPPELQYHHGQPSFSVESTGPFEYQSFDYGNPAFLKAVAACGSLYMTHSMLAWKYEMRRTAQAVLPFLLLGPSAAARDAAFIQDSGITMLVAVRSAAAVKARPHFLDPTTFPSAIGLQHLTIDFDTPHEMRGKLQPTIKAMNDHLEQDCILTDLSSLSDVKKKILVFCESGNERSTALVAAYLMIMYGIDMITAFQMIQSQRFCVSPDDLMKEMLADLGTYLQAQRQVAAHKLTFQASEKHRPTGDRNDRAAVTLNKPTKRSIDRAYESDEEMIDEDWNTVEGSTRGGRSGVAPFADIVK